MTALTQEHKLLCSMPTPYENKLNAQKGIGCSTVEEYAPHDQDVVGLNPSSLPGLFLLLPSLLALEQVPHRNSVAVKMDA